MGSFLTPFRDQYLSFHLKMVHFDGRGLKGLNEMTTIRFWHFTVAMILVGVVIGQVSAASSLSVSSDTVLQEGGGLHGQVLDAQGTPKVNIPVSIRVGNKEIAQLRTNKHGFFFLDGLKGGVYQVVVADQVRTIRCWAPHTAPPIASNGVMIVLNQNLIRAQNCACGDCVGCGSKCRYGGAGGGGLIGWMADHPVITASTIGAAIAIPLATDDDDPVSP